MWVTAMPPARVWAPGSCHPASTRTAPGACWVAAGMGLPSPPNQRKAGQLDPVGQMDGMNYAQANLVGTADPPTV